MKRIVVAGILFLITITIMGCSPESERMANMAERMVRSQNRVNSTMASANEKFVDLNKELQQERTGLQKERLALNGQFENLEYNRRELHLQRRSETGVVRIISISDSCVSGNHAAFSMRVFDLDSWPKVSGPRRDQCNPAARTGIATPKSYCRAKSNGDRTSTC